MNHLKIQCIREGEKTRRNNLIHQNLNQRKRIEEGPRHAALEKVNNGKRAKGITSPKSTPRAANNARQKKRVVKKESWAFKEKEEGRERNKKELHC